MAVARASRDGTHNKWDKWLHSTGGARKGTWGAEGVRWGNTMSGGHSQLDNALLWLCWHAVDKQPCLNARTKYLHCFEHNRPWEACSRFIGQDFFTLYATQTFTSVSKTTTHWFFKIRIILHPSTSRSNKLALSVRSSNCYFDFSLMFPLCLFLSEDVSILMYGEAEKNLHAF